MQDSLWFLNEAGAYFCRYAWAMFVQSGILIVLLTIIDLLIRKYVRAVFRYGIWMLVLVKLVLPLGLCLPTGIGYWCGLDTGPAIGQVTIEPPKNDTYDVIASPEASSTPEYTIHSPEPFERQEKIQAFSLPEEEFAIAPPPPSVEKQAEPVKITASSTLITWQAIVFLVWLLWVLILTLLLLQRFFFVRCLLADSDKAPDPLKKMLRKCCHQMGIRRRVELRLAKAVKSPAVCALVRPVILMPATLVESFNEEKLKVILLHELAHIKRGDLWINFVQTVLHILHFYNPLLFFANAKIRRIREKAVDEMVLTHMGRDVEVYSNTLLDITEMTLSRTQLSLRLVGVVESKKALSGRIKHILSHPIPKSAKLGITGLVVILITAALLLPMTKAAEKQAPDPATEDLKSVSKFPVVEKEESPFLIRGRVTNVKGHALKGNDDIVVDAWAQIQEGRRKGHYQIIAQACANSQNGTYEIKNLDGRPVYIMARDSGANHKHNPNAPTFYPGTLSRDEAELITFTDRQRHRGIDIPMRRQGEYSLTGRVTDRASGEPITKVLVTIYRHDMLFDIFSTYTDMEGRYTFNAVGRGQFIVHVDARSQGYVKTRKQVTLMRDRLQVELDFDLQKGISIRGDFVNPAGLPVGRYAYGKDFPPQPRRPRLGFVRHKGQVENTATDFRYANRYAAPHLRSSTTVWYKEGEGDSTMAYMTFPRNAFGTKNFHIPAVIPGELQFHYQPWRKDWRVKQILYQGKDITQTGLVAQPGRNIEDVTIVLERFEESTTTGDDRTPGNLLSQAEKDLIAKIVSVNRANRKRLHALDYSYQRSLQSGSTYSGRYAFSRNRIYNQYKAVGKSPGLGRLHIESDGRIWKIESSRPTHKKIVLNKKGARMPGFGPDDPWIQMEADIGANLDRYLHQYDCTLSVDKRSVGPPMVIAEMVQRFEYKTKSGASLHKLECYFSITDGYLPKRLVSQSYNEFGAIIEFYTKEYTKINHYPVNDTVFYLPVEFEENYYKTGDRDNTTAWRILEESIRINPDFPDDLFAITLQPGDAVFDKDRNLHWQEPPAGLVGSRAPGFALQDLSEKDKVSLRDIKSQIVVLSFGSTRNKPHQETLTILNTLQTWAQNNNKPMAFYGITDDPIDDINTFKKEHTCQIPFLLDPQGFVIRKYQTRRRPSVVIISRGIIKHVHIGLGPSTNNPALEQHLKEILEAVLEGKEIKDPW